MVLPPLGNVTPLLTALLVPSQTESVPPGHRWVLIAESSPTQALPTSPEVIIVEPEPVKVDAGLKIAQAAVDKMQCIIKSALICLLEPRLEYQLSQIRILEAYVPAHRIKVLAGATTLASIVISGIEFL